MSPAPAPLQLERLADELERQGAAGVWRIHHLPAAVSTNDVAGELARDGAAEGAVVIAEQQSGGRGRLGRAWASPPAAGLWLSALLRPRVPPAEASVLTLVAAVAAAEAVERQTGLRPGIKWPNDIYLRGRKACGILAEIDAEPGLTRHVVLGIGLNVHQRPEDFPPELRATATSLAIELGADPDRTSLCAALLERLAAWYRRFLAEGFGPARVEWLARNVTLGRHVRASGPGGTVSGLAVDLDLAGALLIRLPDGRLAPVTGGEVTLRE